MRYELEEGGALGTDLHCECEPGFTGVECEREDFDHPVQATIGNPLLFQNYWWDNQAAFTETTAAYRLGYEASNAPISGRIDFGGQMEVLEKAIRQTHRLVGNVRDVDSYHLIISPGSGDIIPAIMYALSNGSNIEVTAQQPFYSGYPGAVLAEQNDRMTFVEQPSAAVTNGNTPLIEFVTSPNNPDGTIRSPRFPGSTAIYDCAYWWPHFTPVSPKSEDMMMFTLSKLTGHAGTRVGWALIKDEALAQRIKAYIPSVSHDAQLRAATLLRYTVAQNGGPINFGLTEMTRRWDTFIELFCTDGAACQTPRNARFTLQHPQLASGTRVCAFTGKLTRPNHPYHLRNRPLSETPD
jgi:aspartate/methionine/tyrosine aminotransferase